MNPKTYTCAECQGTFEADWTEEEAQTELEEHFPGWTVADCGKVCDTCYEQLMQRITTQSTDAAERLWIEGREATLLDYSKAIGQEFGTLLKRKVLESLQDPRPYFRRFEKWRRS